MKSKRLRRKAGQDCEKDFVESRNVPKRLAKNKSKKRAGRDSKVLAKGPRKRKSRRAAVRRKSRRFAATFAKSAFADSADEGRLRRRRRDFNRPAAHAAASITSASPASAKTSRVRRQKTKSTPPPPKTAASQKVRSEAMTRTRRRNHSADGSSSRRRASARASSVIPNHLIEEVRFERERELGHQPRGALDVGQRGHFHGRVHVADGDAHHRGRHTRRGKLNPFGLG